jgi:hypothetical protein
LHLKISFFYLETIGIFSNLIKGEFMKKILLLASVLLLALPGCRWWRNRCNTCYENRCNTCTTDGSYEGDNWNDGEYESSKKTRTRNYSIIQKRKQF